jgi:hypothetical protein
MIDLKRLPLGNMQRLNAVKKLPPGHVAIREAEEAVEKEYLAASKQEAAFCKKYKRRVLFASLQEAADFSGNLCRVVGSRLIKEVRYKEPGYEHCGAYYRLQNRTIYMPSYGITITTLTHETSHHICNVESLSERSASSPWHGENFLMIEQMLFDYLLSQR